MPCECHASCTESALLAESAPLALTLHDGTPLHDQVTPSRRSYLLELLDGGLKRNIRDRAQPRATHHMVISRGMSMLSVHHAASLRHDARRMQQNTPLSRYFLQQPGKLCSRILVSISSQTNPHDVSNGTVAMTAHLVFAVFCVSAALLSSMQLPGTHWPQPPQPATLPTLRWHISMHIARSSADI